MKSSEKIDVKNWGRDRLNYFLIEKTKFGLIDFAFSLALVLMDVPVGRPIFGSKIPDDLIRSIKKTLREAAKGGLNLEIPDSIRSGILEGRQSGQPVKKKYAIVCLWAPLVKRKDEISWSMLARLRSWFYERLEGKQYREEIRAKINIKNLGKELKKKCLPKIEQNKETIEAYLRAFHFNSPQRIFFPRAVNFARDSIEVEADYQNGGELKTLRMKLNFKTKEFTEVLLDLSDRSVFGTVTFS